MDSPVSNAAIEVGSGMSWAIFFATVPLLAALIGVFITYLWSRSIAKKTLTFDTLRNQMWDKDYISARQSFIRIRELGNGHLIKMASEESQKEDDATIIRNILNDYELVSIGIKRKILDCRFYRDWYRTTLITDFRKVEPYIQEARRVTGKAELYINFEKLAKTWEKSKN